MKLAENVIAVSRTGRVYDRPASMPIFQWLEQLRIAREQGIISRLEFVEIARKSEGLDAEPKA